MIDNTIKDIIDAPKPYTLERDTQYFMIGVRYVIEIELPDSLWLFGITSLSVPT